MAKKAFIVGVNTYGLQYAEKDASRMEECLKKYQYEIFKTNGNKKDIISCFDSMLDSCNQTDIVIVYFSGHAIIEGNALYFLLEETPMNSSKINIDHLILKFNKSNRASSKLVILDCCNSGSARWDSHFADNIFILTSSGRFERSREFDNFKAGFLTYYFCNNILNPCHEFIDKDYKIRLKRFYNWIKIQAQMINSSEDDIDVSIPHLFGDHIKDIEIVKVSSSYFFPSDFDELIEKEKNLSFHVKRNALINEIRKQFKRENFIILKGQPLVGKSRLLENLSENLSCDYVTLEISSHGCRVEKSDTFIYDLAEKTIIEFKRWAEQNSIDFLLDSPTWDHYSRGNAQIAFSQLLRLLKKKAGKLPLLFIIDEIEHLLDRTVETDKQSFVFLDWLVRNPKNGFFIFAGSQYIDFSHNEQFGNIIAKGRVLHVPYYEKGIVQNIYAAVQKYIDDETDIIPKFCVYTNGHPRIIRYLVDELLKRFKYNLTEQHKKIIENDFDLIIESVTAKSCEILWMLWKRLSIEEKFITWLISRELYTDFKYNCDKIIELSKHHIENTAIDIDKGIKKLILREWAEWCDDNKMTFRFKLGIFPHWIQYYSITLENDLKWKK
ncbi:AAA ATPase-like domain-containing protein [Desulfonema limicola]|uniref:AAA ATPase-like domain-containing protein n=1 Tax=Desulfonema limicola TaxID=45656 RepID=A0A975GIU9_9BACT|nr:caspase family protein [Desulfonema limicola]QTA82739.1 AAA ATPase-like domain-containing protein [Desulfonema limicola]